MRRPARAGILSVIAVAALAALLVLPGSAVAYDPQGNYQNPVTATPPIVVPPTASCPVVLLHAWAFDNEIGQGTAYGSYAPPAGCPGPWNLVVLNWSTSVRGVQYDRIGTLAIGGVQIFRTINAEPDPAGISWNVYKDVTEYSPVLAAPHTFMAEMNNYVFGPYTGVLFVNATLTFYEASAIYPAPAAANAILPVTNATLSAGENSSVILSSVPNNISSASIEIYATGHSCDEFWYTNVPTSFLSNPYAAPNGLCGRTALREVNVWVDGLFAGFALPFPYIYTGGINPYLWEPIPGVNDFNIPPYVLDLTPFAALLSDGQPQNITVGIWNNDGYWIVNANLFLDEQSRPTTGNLTVRGASFGETVTSTIVNLTDNPDFNVSADFTTSAYGNFLASGYINTPTGPVTTTITQRYDFSNQQNYLLSDIDSQENVSMLEKTSTVVSTQGPGYQRTQVETETYPLEVAAGFYAVPQGYLIPASVEMGYIDTAAAVTTTGHGAPSAWGSATIDLLSATSNWIYGSSLLPTASTTEMYTAADTSGPIFTQFLGASNGFVVLDIVLTPPA